MSRVSPAVQILAQRILALEAACDHCAQTVPEAVRICDQLRVPLAKLCGVAGYRALLSRAVALAKAEDISLSPVSVRDDSTLDGFDPIRHPNGGFVLVSQLLGLLVTFIGDTLTRQLLREVWPAMATDEPDGEHQ
ncbi:hypothetical protein BH11PLA2_BH11PLA2_19070 [soil metagenome]